MSDYPEILQDLADKAVVFLVEEGLEKDRAQAISKKLAEHIRIEWGGQNQYIPKGISFECTQRHYEIFEKFRGDNYAQLAREYDLTEMRIRQIINAVRAVEMGKRQGGLF